MTIADFLEEYNGLTKDRQRIGRIKFLEEIIDRQDDLEDFIIDMMNQAVYIEEDDGFGTEGASI